MIDEIKLGQAQHRGVRAAELLENTLLQEAFAYLESEYMNGWLSTGSRDTEAREKLWQAVHVPRNIREHLKLHVTNGRIAAEDLRRLSEESKRKSK